MRGSCAWFSRVSCRFPQKKVNGDHHHEGYCLLWSIPDLLSPELNSIHLFLFDWHSVFGGRTRTQRMAGLGWAGWLRVSMALNIIIGRTWFQFRRNQLNELHRNNFRSLSLCCVQCCNHIFCVAYKILLETRLDEMLSYCNDSGDDALLAILTWDIFGCWFETIGNRFLYEIFGESAS